MPDDASTDAQLTDYDGPQDSLEGDVPKRRQAFTAYEIADQTRIVQDWLAAGVRPNVIRQRCSDRWGFSTRTAEHRMHAARRQMIADINIMDRAENVIEQALDSRMGANAIGAMRLQADLLQLIQKRGN